MKLHGSTTDNLRAAIGRAERLRGRPVYRETCAHRAAPIAEAQRVRTQTAPAALPALDTLIARLAAELAERRSAVAGWRDNPQSA